MNRVVKHQNTNDSQEICEKPTSACSTSPTLAVPLILWASSVVVRGGKKYKHKKLMHRRRKIPAR